MGDSLLDQLKARGEAFFTEISNNLMANPTFIEMLKKGIQAKEAVDKQVAEALKNVNVATRRDVSKLEARIAELERELSARRPAPRKAAPKKPAPRRKATARRS
jgi:polyhydroxyalkanoate synthesis regulator phasin